MPASSRLLAQLSILLPVLGAAAVLAAAAILGAGRLQRPDARSPVAMRPGEVRGAPAREFIERGATGPSGIWPTSPPSPPGSIDDPDDR